MKISIITPCRNQEQFIRATILSIADNIGNLEVEHIIVDGQSSDTTLNSIKELAERYPHIRYLSEPDNGQTNAINKGLKMATGDILGFLNADDVYEPGALQKIHQFFIENPGKQWAYGKCKIINEKGEEIQKPITFYKNILMSHYRLWTLLITDYICQPACFWRRSAMNEVGWFDESQHLVMDYEYWLRLGKKYAPGFLSVTLARFRIHRTSKSSTQFHKQFQEETLVAQKYTQNPLLHFLHKLHAGLVIALYSIIKR